MIISVMIVFWSMPFACASTASITGLFIVGSFDMSIGSWTDDTGSSVFVAVTCTGLTAGCSTGLASFSSFTGVPSRILSSASGNEEGGGTEGVVGRSVRPGSHFSSSICFSVVISACDDLNSPSSPRSSVRCLGRCTGETGRIGPRGGLDGLRRGLI